MTMRDFGALSCCSVEVSQAAETVRSRLPDSPSSASLSRRLSASLDSQATLLAGQQGSSGPDGFSDLPLLTLAISVGTVNLHFHHNYFVRGNVVWKCGL